MNHPVIPIAVAQAAPDQRRRAAPRGRRVQATALAEVQALLGDEARAPRRELLIEYLHCIQDAHGQLATPHLAALAQLMRLPQAEVFEVASFYHHFDIVREDATGDVPAPPQLTVRVCTSLSCELAGAQALLQRLPAMLGDAQGQRVRVLPAPCVGRCDTAPVAVVHQHPVPHATPDTVLAATRAGQRLDAPPAQAIGLPGYLAQGGYQLLRMCLAGQRPVEDVLATLDDAGLRGLGGAGFPTGRKWRIVREQPAPRWLAVNIDEGEPGTFKDRWVLEQDPHRFLEGMLVAAWAVGAAHVVIYLRDEYHGLRALLQLALDAMQAHVGAAAPAARHASGQPAAPGEAAPPGLAGIGHALPVIELRRGAGAYICGEESAMLESIEGKRGWPRLRPPYVAQVGLFGRPTLVHNVETLFWVRDLLERGTGWFTSQGRRGRRGLRSFSVSGRVRLPGVKRAPAGINLRELIDEHCGGMLPGHTLYAYLPGGASGGILPAALADLPLDFDTLQPHGCFIGSAAVIVLSQHDSAVAAARNVMRFFADESCGQCTPCRAGTAKAAELLQQPQWNLPLLDELSHVMREASICGLGQAAPNVVDCVRQHFPHELGSAVQPPSARPGAAQPAPAHAPQTAAPSAASHGAADPAAPHGAGRTTPQAQP